jgi:hypothetical protein
MSTFGRAKTKNKIGKSNNNVYLEVSPKNNTLDPSQTMEVDEIFEDAQWKMNEEIMQGFQNNMALIAGNSFEILQMFLMIQNDYQKVTEKLQ